MIIDTKQQKATGNQYFFFNKTDYYTYLEHAGKAEIARFRDADGLKAFLRNQLTFCKPLCDTLCMVADVLSKRENQFICAVGDIGVVVKSYNDRPERFEFTMDHLTSEAKKVFEKQRRQEAYLNGLQY